MRLLIIDDDAFARWYYKKAFNLYGCQVIGSVKNGEQAINLYKNLSNKPDLILIDYHMPKKNGLEAMKEILQINRSQKIIFTSSDTRIEKEALSSGALNFEVKPIPMKKILEYINANNN